MKYPFSIKGNGCENCENTATCTTHENNNCECEMYKESRCYEKKEFIHWDKNDKDVRFITRVLVISIVAIFAGVFFFNLFYYLT